MNSTTSRAAGVTAMAIFLGSVGQLVIRLDWLGLVVAIAWSALATTIIFKVAPRFSPRAAVAAAVTVCVVALVAVAALYPSLNVQSGHKGTDTDDDIRIATERALRLEYPFDGRTYLDNVTSHMPGAVVVAAPFVAAHAIQFQNIAFIVAGCVALWRRSLSTTARMIVLLGAAACVGHWHQLVTGVSTVAEWIFITIVAVALVEAPNRRRRLWLSVLFAIAVTIRVNVLAVAAVPPAVLWFKVGRRAAVEAATVCGATMAALVLPFVVGNRNRFQPFNVGGERFVYLDRLVPHGSSLLPGLLVVLGVMTAIVIVALAARRQARSVAATWAIASIQVWQTGGLVVLSLLAAEFYEAQSWSDYLRVVAIPLLFAAAELVNQRTTIDTARAAAIP